jgi:hypothetical protein
VAISVNILGLGLKMHSMMIFVTVRDLSLPLMDKVDVKQCVNFNYVKCFEVLVFKRKRF